MTGPRITVYISIGNSDDRMTQRDWNGYFRDVEALLQPGGWKVVRTIHGAWQSPSAAPWQNACWCVELDQADKGQLQADLRRIAISRKQDGIAWAEAPVTEFLGPTTPTPEERAAWGGQAA